MFSLFSCPECESMQGMRDFSLDQPREDMSALMCIHSRAAEYLTADYQNHWNIPLPGSEDTTHRITLNDDILVQSLKDERGDLFLGAYQNNGTISLLYCVSAKQKIPFCSICASPKCKCFHAYKQIINEACEENGLERPEYHWERRQHEAAAPLVDYSDTLELSEHYKKYGYNAACMPHPWWWLQG